MQKTCGKVKEDKNEMNEQLNLDGLNRRKVYTDLKVQQDGFNFINDSLFIS